MNKTLASRIFSTLANVAAFAIALAIAITPAILTAYRTVA